MRLVGIEIGGTKLQIGVGDENGGLYLLKRGKVERWWQSSEILDWVIKTTKEILSSLDPLEKPSAIGIGFGGPVDSNKGSVLTSHQIAGWQGYPLKRRFEEEFSLPVIVANDANSSGWAEYVCGAGKGTRNFFYMNIGSGIGGALVIDGKLYDGQGYGAGEIGHTYVPDWTRNELGAFDKLENICSGWNIEKRLKTEGYVPKDSLMYKKGGGYPESFTCKLLAECAREGDSFAVAELDRVSKSLSIAISNVITLFNPEKIALGGGVSLMGDVLIERIKEKVDEIVFGPFKNKYEILPCALGEQVVLVGAILLASDLVKDGQK
ncbi:MAG: ROK family protein [Candidatus Hydrogenedentes bacterium]|nr:ROK family protein [Candidatus Hydrogenedentota bacterium]